MSKKTKSKYLTIEADGWLTDEGVEISVYIGDTDFAQLEVTHSYEEMIEQHLDSYLFDGKIIKLHKDKVARFIAKMKEISEYAAQRAKELGL